MNFQNSILTAVTFFPLLGALVVAFWGRGSENNRDALMKIATGISLVEFLLSIPLALTFKADAGYQFVADVPWIDALSVRYHIGLDGLSIWLVMLTTFIMPIAFLSSFNYITKRVREYLVLMFLLEVGMIGVFAALDMFLFYLFWEVMLIPMYFIIGVWGGQRRIYAAVKFVLYTMVGSLLMLVAIIALYVMSGTFDLPIILDMIAKGTLTIDPQTQAWLFAAFALAFFIKVPLFPFHTWLPDAHVEAPTAGSLILASVLLKMGVYGLIRFNLPLFPDASLRFAPIICTLAVIGIIYGALVAMVQPDFKKLIAYSSVSHLGFCVLGIFAMTPQGLQGALFQMLAHGLSTGALFLIIGMIYERRHTRQISELGGLATPMPHFATLFLITTFASVGLPLLCGFVGEFLVLIGTFTSQTLPHPRLFAAFAATAMIWGAVYMLWLYQRVMMGDVTKPENRTLADLSLREKLVLWPLVVMMVVLGVYPVYFTRRSQPALDAAIHYNSSTVPFEGASASAAEPER